MPPTNPAQFRQCDSSPSDVCLDNFRNEDGFGADGLSLDMVRTILCIVTDLLAPAYIVLSFVAIASRYNSSLKLLASHGKTSTTKRKTEAKTKTKAQSESNETTGTNTLTSKSRTSWCWVSKRYFSHFYVVGLLSTGITTAVCLWNNEHSRHVTRDGSPLPYSWNAADLLLVVHLLRRAYECVCVQQYTKESSKMHVVGYALGVGYYLVLPLVFRDIGDTAATVSAISGVANNSSSRSSSSSSSSTNNNIDFDAPLSVSESFGSATSATNAVLGMMIGVNLWLQYEQHVHHDILASMRRTKPKDNKDRGNDAHATNRGDENSDVDADADADANASRKLPGNRSSSSNNNNTPRHYSLPPYRRWFRYVLSPHYLAEILLYASFAALLEAAAAPAAKWEEQNPQEAPPPMAEGTCVSYTCTHIHGGWLRSALPLLSSGRANRHWALLVWVATNLTVSALNTHDWYHSRECQTDTTTITTTTSNDPLATNEAHDSRKAIVPLLL